MDTATLAYWPADTRTALLEQTVGDALRAAAAEAPDQVAIVEGHPAPSPRRTLTYRGLLVAAQQVARALLAGSGPASTSPSGPATAWSGSCWSTARASPGWSWSPSTRPTRPGSWSTCCASPAAWACSTCPASAATP